jgi:hypothetical protein
VEVPVPPAQPSPIQNPMNSKKSDGKDSRFNVKVCILMLAIIALSMAFNSAIQNGYAHIEMSWKNPISQFLLRLEK